LLQFLIGLPHSIRDGFYECTFYLLAYTDGLAVSGDGRATISIPAESDDNSGLDPVIAIHVGKSMYSASCRSSEHLAVYRGGNILEEF